MRFGSFLLAFAIAMLILAVGKPASACGTDAHIAAVKAPVPATVGAVSITAADRQQADQDRRQPCSGHGCCQTGAACTIACANAGLIFDHVEAPPPLGLPVTESTSVARAFGFVVDPALDPPRRSALI